MGFQGPFLDARKVPMGWGAAGESTGCVCVSGCMCRVCMCVSGGCVSGACVSGVLYVCMSQLCAAPSLDMGVRHHLTPGC